MACPERSENDPLIVARIAELERELAETRAKLEPFKDVAHRFSRGWLGEEQACEQLVALLKQDPSPYALEIARLQDVVLSLHAERAECVVKLDALREEVDQLRITACTPAERAVLDAARAWRLSWDDHESAPSEEELPEEFALFCAVGSLMAEPMVADFEAELARRGEARIRATMGTEVEFSSHTWAADLDDERRAHADTRAKLKKAEQLINDERDAREQLIAMAGKCTAVDRAVLDAMANVPTEWLEYWSKGNVGGHLTLPSLSELARRRSPRRDPLIAAIMAVPRLCAPDATCNLIDDRPICYCPGCEVRVRIFCQHDRWRDAGVFPTGACAVEFVGGEAPK
jgi:hypothetical protein